MDKLPNEEFNRLIIEYYKTGELTKDIFTHLETIGSYTANKPNFKGYSSHWLDEMKEQARAKALVALTKKKFDPERTKPVHYFGTLYYHEFIDFIRAKNRMKGVLSGELDLRGEATNNETLSVDDPTSLLSPFIAWVNEGPLEVRFPIFLRYHYPEMLSEEGARDINKLEEKRYLQVFPGAVKKPQVYATSNVHIVVNNLRQMLNCVPVEDEGLIVNLQGLNCIIDSKIKGK